MNFRLLVRLRNEMEKFPAFQAVFFVGFHRSVMEEQALSADTTTLPTHPFEHHPHPNLQVSSWLLSTERVTHLIKPQAQIRHNNKNMHGILQ